MSNTPALGLSTMALAIALVSSSGCSSSASDGSSDSGATGSGANGSGANGSGANGSGANGSGATSTGGSGNTYVPPTCDQGCQDYLTAWALNDTIWFLWNQKLAGHPVGPQDTMGPCPLGGDVHITGFDDVADNGITTADVTFDMTDCENSNETYTLTFTGAVQLQGSFNAATEFAAVTFSSTALESSGTIFYLDDPPIEETCVANITQTGMNDGFDLSGRLCGRDFNESSLELDGSGGSGSGGSSGGSGNACMCLCPDGSDCTNASEPNPCGVDADGIPNACGCPLGCP